MKILLLCSFLLISTVISEPFLTVKDLKLTVYNKKSQNRKAPKTVYIRSFKALFQVFAEASASTMAKKVDRADKTTFTSGTTTRMGVQIAGVDLEDFQSVIDQAYNSFVAQLTEQGFEIMTAEEASKSEFYADYTKVQGGASSDDQASGFVMITPQGYEYLVKGISKDGKEKGTFLEVGPKISKELGDVYVADANFIFSFVSLDANSSSIANTSSVKAKVDYKLVSFMNTTIENKDEGLKGLAGGLTSTFTNAGTANLLTSQVRFVSGSDFANNPFFDVKVELKKSKFSFDDVFKDKKIKESTLAQTEIFEKTGYTQLIMSSGTQKSVASHFAECDRERYVNATAGSIKDMMDTGIAKFQEMAKGK